MVTIRLGFSGVGGGGERVPTIARVGVFDLTFRINPALTMLDLTSQMTLTVSSDYAH